MVVPKKKQCPYCHSDKIVKDGRRKLATGGYSNKFFCSSCGKHWSLKKTTEPALPKNASAIFVGHLSALHIRQLARTYAIGKNKIHALIAKCLTRVKDSIWIALHLKPQWSGVLLVAHTAIRIRHHLYKKNKRNKPGEVCCNKPVWLCSLDCATGDLPHYSLVKKQSAANFRDYFRELRESGYCLNVLVCKHDARLVAAAKNIFGDQVTVQFCTKHFVGQLKKRAHKHRNNAKVVELVDTIERLVTTHDIAVAEECLRKLNAEVGFSNIEKKLLAFFKKYSQELVAHLLHLRFRVPIPKTIEQVEKIFHILQQRLSDLRQFKDCSTAGAYLSAWALMYRLTPLEFSGELHAHSPLARAGVTVAKLDMLNMDRSMF